MEQPNIEPLENYVLSGFANRLQQVFGCQAVFVTEQSRTEALRKLASGGVVSYPYIFATLKGVGPNPDSYNPHALGRRGTPIVVNENYSYTARIMPANFDIDIEYHTNNYQDFTGQSVAYFMRLWMFARRFGYLKFNIGYGRTSLAISSTLTDTPDAPPKESNVDGESPYKVTANVMVHGFVSETSLGIQDVINQLVVDTVVQGTTESSQFFSF